MDIATRICGILADWFATEQERQERERERQRELEEMKQYIEKPEAEREGLMGGK